MFGKGLSEVHDVASGHEETVRVTEFSEEVREQVAEFRCLIHPADRTTPSDGV